MSSARDQMQLPLSKENDSSEDAGRRTVTSKENTQQENPPKIRKWKSHFHAQFWIIISALLSCRSSWQRKPNKWLRSDSETNAKLREWRKVSFTMINEINFWTFFLCFSMLIQLINSARKKKYETNFNLNVWWMCSWAAQKVFMAFKRAHSICLR